MFELLLLVVMSWAAIRSSVTLRRNRALFLEFRASEAITLLVCLFPLGPLVLLLLNSRIGLLPAGALALACYAPGLVTLGPARAVFDRTGTDRVKVVQEALAIVFIAGVGGVAYVLSSVVIRTLLAVSTPYA